MTVVPGTAAAGTSDVDESLSAAGGQAYWFYTPQGTPPGTAVILRFSGVAVARAPS